MLIMIDPGLSEATAAFLATEQAAIDEIDDFSRRKQVGKDRWDRRVETVDGAVAFDEIKATLKEMAIGRKYCNYCEHNIIMKSTLEHIRPKSSFPGYAFRWDNLLYACENCNLGYKKAIMYVFSPSGSTMAHKTGQGEPPTDDLAFIHPRYENGLDFMELSFVDFQFYATHPDGSREFVKFEKTREILHLDDPDLVHSREAAFDDFKKCLGEYCKVMNASSHAELIVAVNGVPCIEVDQPLEVQKTNILEAIRASFLKKTHLTVWREMQRRQTELPESLQDLFRQSGAALW